MAAREAALATFESVKTTPTSLINYQSNGRVIVFGDKNALKRCDEFAEALQLTRICMDAKPGAGNSPIVALNQREINIGGYLGNFVVSLVDSQGVIETLQADIILDLNPEPLITLDIPPPGYLHESPADRDSTALEDRLIEMTGEFEKPKYFTYNASICAHGVNGKTVCTNCIDACPAGAISSLIETIEVDPHLCQGGGTCATGCLSGASQDV